ncbi:hypothetical protein WJX72_010991 [[Myrmecia] bisecta]|uniref:AB hydrolase-1 domain-containing protein n=1 Tax=[Myrmecia] bisecta TaxID=41462 RepID=A0AAW1Q3W5_9CHLO
MQRSFSFTASEQGCRRATGGWCTSPFQPTSLARSSASCSCGGSSTLEPLSSWFHNAPFEQITRGNVEEFVAYAFYDSTPANLSDKARQLTSNFVDACECTWGISFRPARPRGKLYTATWPATGLSAIAISCRPVQDLPYWLRQPAAPGNAAREQPLMFLHGVGFGLAVYVQFISAMLRTFPGRTIIVAEFAHVSLRVATRATAVDDIVDSVQALLKAHGVADACILAHSFGCFVASRLCQMHPKVVHSLALLDPVCMMLCFPQLLHSFIYKPFDFSALMRLSGIVDVARWFCSRDLGIAEAFCRNFIWHSLMLWPEDLPARTLLCMGTQDDLVPAALVRAQLTHAGSTAQVLECATGRHGAFLFDMEWQRQILDASKALFDGDAASPG